MEQYDGKGHGVSVSSGGIEGFQVRYARAVNGPYSTVAPLFTNAVAATTVWCELSAPGYITQTNSATVTVTKRPVTLTSGSASKVYDGMALTKKTVAVSGSGWVSGQGATCTYKGAQTNVGSSTNTFTYTLNSGTLAANYTVTQKYGTLTVTKATAGGGTGGTEPGSGTVPSGGYSKFNTSAMYDGFVHTINTNALVTAFASAMKGTSIYRYAIGTNTNTVPTSGWAATAPVITNAGSAIVWYKVTNANYNDFAHAAKVTVTKRPVTLTSGSASKVYDGAALMKKTVAVSGSGWVSGQGATYTYAGTQTNVGSSSNGFSYTLASGTLESNYAITLVYGILTVKEAGWVSNVEVRQRYPWNGKVDVSFTITGESGAKYRPSFTVTDIAGGTNLTVKTFYKADGTLVSESEQLAPGTYKWVWDAGIDCCDRNYGRVKMSVAVEQEDSALGGVQLWENGPYWAECNVGATKPEEYGYYFWWGDTVGYTRNASNSGWVSVKDGTSFTFSTGNCPTYGKDNSALASAGYIDLTGNLVAAYDAVTVHLGAPWRMPTVSEWYELVSNCDIQSGTRNGVYGLLVTGKGDFLSNSIFLPYAGFGSVSSLDYSGSSGYYWPSTPSSFNPNYTWNISFYLGEIVRDTVAPRYYGQPVRPVRGCSE